MRLAEVRNIIHQVIAEVKKEKTEAKNKPKTEKKPEVKSKMGSNLPKSSGKLADLKKEMQVLKQMKESLGQLQITEGDDSQFVAEYKHMEKYVDKLEEIKSAHTKLSEMLDNQIEQVNERIISETAKIKEMMGLGEKPNMKDKAKKAKKVEKKDDSKSKKPTELNENSFSSIDAMLKAAKTAILAGETVTADGEPVAQVIIPLGKFKLVNGTTLSFADAEEIAINGEPIELELSKPKPYTDKRTPDQKAKDAEEFQKRFGPGGGYQTSRGFYTGD